MLLRQPASFKLPVTNTFAGSAPTLLARSASSAVCIPIEVKFPSTARKNQDREEYFSTDRLENRPLKSNVGVPLRCAKRSTLGQISVSKNTSSDGSKVKKALLTIHGWSKGKKIALLSDITRRAVR